MIGLGPILAAWPWWLLFFIPSGLILGMGLVAAVRHGDDDE